jgi:tRNA G18 (ribose-2'-O)-methylase SpoU
VVEALDLPELRPYREMHWTGAQETGGVFVAEGDKVVRRLLRRREFAVVSLLVTEEKLHALADEIQARGEPVEVFLAPPEVLRGIVGFPVFQGALALGRVPPMPEWAALARPAGTGAPPLVVALDGVTNAQNTGAVARCAGAFGATGFVTSETGAPPWVRRAVRGSMGALFDLRARRAGDLAEAVRALRRLGLRAVAADLRPGAVPVETARLDGPLLVVLGNEDTGIRPEVAAACDEIVAVPMPPTVDSLNVACAAAVVLYEVSRRRAMARGDS